MITSKEIAHKIADACEIRGMKVAPMLRKAKLDKNAIQTMINGSMPGADKIAAIAVTLNVPTDYLLGVVEKLPSSRAADFIQRYDALDDDGKDVVAHAIITEARRMAAEQESV